MQRIKQIDVDAFSHTVISLYWFTNLKQNSRYTTFAYLMLQFVIVIILNNNDNYTINISIYHLKRFFFVSKNDACVSECL